MALIVEDGSIVIGANSYRSRAAIIAYALSRNVVLPDTTATDANAINAMDYLLRYDNRWQGELVEPGIQALAWPRQCVYLGKYRVPTTTVPDAIGNAQAQLAMYSFQGIVLLPTNNTEPFVTSEKIGPIQTDYSADIELKSGSTPDLPAIDAILSNYLNGGGRRLTTVRV
jgi:hypothetical protein